MITIIGGDGKAPGPVPEDQVRRWLAEGRATVDTQARREGEEAWLRLGDFPEFAGKTESEPPAVNTPFEVRDESGCIPAGRLVRLVASIVDSFLSMVFAMPGLVMIAYKLISEGNLEELDPEHIHVDQLGEGALVMFAGLLILAGIQMWLLTLRGQTVGKRLLGIRIVRVEDGSNPGFLKAVFQRWMIPGFLSSISWNGLGVIFFLADVCFIFRRDRRCIHDLIAGTRVIENEPEERRF